MATSITRRNITWNFDADYTVGQFANGDYYVVDPGGGIVINTISPASSFVGARAINGSMIDPNPTSTNQGYDSGAASPPYVQALNVAWGISEGSPLIINAGHSLISSESFNPASETISTPPMVKSVEILTVLSEAPAAGSFRPGYSTLDKTIRYNVSDIDYGKLTNLTQVAGQVDTTTAASYINGTWIDHNESWTGRMIHPDDAMPNYGREISGQLGTCALTLLCNYTNAQKETLLIRFLQIGIDLYSQIERGGDWPCDGGHMPGRKWPVMFMGYMFEDSAVMAVFAKSGDYLYSGSYYEGNMPPDYLRFGEDDQAFYITARDVARDHTDPREEYEAEDIGVAEWGIRHADLPALDNEAWTASYRVNNGITWSAHALSCLICGLKTTWNNDAYFDYVYRFMETDSSTFSIFIRNMYNTYWETYAGDVPDPPGGNRNSY